MYKKLFGSILSFVMVAMLAFSSMGIYSSEEGIYIPIIEEVAEEELTEFLSEEENVELYADGNVAKIGDVSYETLKDAINAAKNGETINLLSDVTFSEQIKMEANKSIVIDGANNEGNNYTIYDNAGTSNGFYIAYGHITFTNINIRKAPGNTAQGNNAAFRLLAGGGVTLGDYAVLGGTSTATAKYGNGGVVYASTASGNNRVDFTLNGEGARIEYLSSAWRGVFASNSANDVMEINLLKGEIVNCTGVDGLIVANANTTVNLGDVVITNSKTPTVKGDSVNAINITGGGTLGTIKASSSKINFKKNLTYNTSETYAGGDFTGSATLAITDETEPSSYADVESGMLISGAVTTTDMLLMQMISRKELMWVLLPPSVNLYPELKEQKHLLQTVRRLSLTLLISLKIILLT